MVPGDCGAIVPGRAAICNSDENGELEGRTVRVYVYR